MKKLFAVLLGLVLVLGLSSMALAASESFSGSVEVTWSDSNTKADPGAVFGGSRSALISVDYAKDFSETVSAGLKVKVDFNTHNKLEAVLNVDTDGDGVVDTSYPVTVNVDDDGTDVNPFGYANFDGAGYIKIKSDMADVTAWTAIKGSAGKDISTGDIEECPGLQVDVKALEGLNATLILNNGSDAIYNFVVKGSYAMEGVTVGGGYSSEGAPSGSKAKTAFDVNGSYALEDLGLTVGAEYASRNNGTDKSGSDYLIKASYTGIEGLTVNGSYEAKDKLYGQTTTDALDADSDAKEIFTYSTGKDASKIAADATYQLSEELSVNGAITYCSFNVTPAETATTIKVGASFKAMENLVLSGSYQTTTYKVDPKESTIGVMDLKAEYTFAPGVVGSFEYKTYSFKLDVPGFLTGSADTGSYTAKISASF